MLMKKVLITATNYETLCGEGLKLLREYGCEVVINEKNRMFTREEMLKAVGDIDGLIAHCEKWDEILFDNAPKLKIIARFGVGYESIDLEVAKRYGVRVTNCPGINSNAVAEMTIALLMALIREIPRLNKSQKEGIWSRTIFSELLDKRIGILGFGAIAKKTVKKLKGFGVDILIYNRTLRTEQAEALGASITTDLDEVLNTSDYILIHLPVTPETVGIINEDNIAKMKDGAYVINTARASLVDNKAMYAALVSGKLRGYATDVYSVEPVDLSDPLFSLQNFIGTPHSAGETYENYRETGLATARAVLDVFEGREPWHLLV